MRRSNQQTPTPTDQNPDALSVIGSDPPQEFTATETPQPTFHHWTAAQAVLAVARTLKPCELHVLLYLAALAEHRPLHCCKASSRQITAATGVSRRNVQHALDTLTARGHIAMRPGTATQAAAYAVLVLNNVTLGGANLAPPPAAQTELFSATPGVNLAPPLASNQRQGGVKLAPPPTENTGDPDAPFDISIVRIPILDRILNAKPTHHSKSALEEARKWIHGYMCKFGPADSHAPDDYILAQFLAVAPWPDLQRLLYDLMAERRKPGYSYAWYVTTAAQRIHGIKAGALKAGRDSLRLVKHPTTATPPPPPNTAATPATEEELNFQDTVLQQLARTKTMR